ncbi:MAG: hypothetical protein IPJ46_22080 [Anaerolineales bacterium]|nr:hypothetical protein [Anaerolineales bacterium]
MKELMEQLAQMGMNRERIEQIRKHDPAKYAGDAGQMEQFAGERIAENLSEKPRGENIDNLMNRPFEALSDSDKQLLQREVKKLAAALRTASHCDRNEPRADRWMRRRPSARV